MGYLIRRLSEREPQQIICGTLRELTDKTDFENLNISHVQIGGETKKHYHNKMTEFYFVLNGEIKMDLDGKIEKCGEGTLIKIEPGTKHKAYGNAEVLVIASPAFDPDDEIVVE